MGKIRIVHYLNQFFGGIGGEEKAMTEPFAEEKPIGPGLALQKYMKDIGEVVATVVCGDDYFNNDKEKASKEVLEIIKKYSPDFLVAGPSYAAGRYGLACAQVCKIVKEELNIEVITGMHPENPGAEQADKSFYIVQTPNRVRNVAKDIKKISDFSKKLIRKEKIGCAQAEGYIPKGFRKNVVQEKLAAARAVEGLIAKLNGKTFNNEIPKPNIYVVEPAEPIKDMKKAKIALVTEGALFPKGNPDRIEAAWATKFGKYFIGDYDSMPAEVFHCYHSGVNTTYINEDPNRLVPLDALVKLKNEGEIGQVYDYMYATCGCAMPIENGREMGKKIAKGLLSDGVNGAILTST
ncbi:glycine reductase [Maledivibacter halophilus]|uniref:Glycine reductase n=3 Tax=Maledivibacter halophilus TaxID=36842 RepID=A0A1T5M2F3_9FIRM|nr:glycine/betaine/sarcosine/D-proline family reductase selenoprotein B [Maledivibacter halophilus]SKC82376.1 glycine reductase [Maledivibacter halophilus]